MAQIYNFKCDGCRAQMKMMISPNNALVQITCLRCAQPVFTNQSAVNTQRSPRTVGNNPAGNNPMGNNPMGNNPMGVQALGQSFDNIKVPPPIPPQQKPPTKRIRIKEQYTIVKQLGEGTMGRVFLAHDDKNNKNVAIKILINKDEKLRKYFQREALVLNDLQHPNIIAFEGCGNHNGHLYIVMEYVEGQTLLDLLNGQAIKPHHGAQIISFVLSALHYAYQHNIVHRDIKPANIFVTKNREVKVIDLGLGKVITESVDLTKTGQIMGTCFYMPLEQIQRSKDAGHAADIYAIGATLYHSLAGVPPFEECGRTLDKLFYAKLKNHYIRLKERKPELPDEIINIVEKAMSHEPKDRYQTAEEMRIALQTFLQNYKK